MHYKAPLGIVHNVMKGKKSVEAICVTSDFSQDGVQVFRC